SGIRLFANLTLDSSGARWKTVTSTVIEGGARYRHGVWHSAEHCRMNECFSEDFCPVCKAAIAAPRKIPSRAASLSVKDGVVSRQPGGPDPAVAWWIQVMKHDGWSDYTMIRKLYVEPQQTSLDVSD